jgi:hypothetical protein
MDTLTGTYGFKLKGMHWVLFITTLACLDFTRNEHEQLCISPQRYIEKMVDFYKCLFKENPPSKAKLPLDSNDQNSSVKKASNVSVTYWFDAMGHQYRPF